MRPLLALSLLIGCRPANSPDDGWPAPVFTCDAWEQPERPSTRSCDDPDPSAPDALGSCDTGSGHAGVWTVDADGLPAYDLLIDQRCDPAGQHWSPRPDPQGDPVHLLGNGRGLVAMARASGAVEVYTQDRGHKWINRADTWVDPEDPGYPPQQGGGFSWVALGGGVGSTRFDDLGVNNALAQQSRRFGVGYVRTATDLGPVRVERTVFAPNAEARALVAEVVVHNATLTPQSVGLVEVWDVNLHPLPVELVTSDLLFEGVTASIDRGRRARMAEFEQTIAWDAEQRLATVLTEALTPGVSDPSTPSEVDWYPDPVFLGVLDDAVPDAVWLDDRELFAGSDRAPPAAAGAIGSPASRTVELSGEGQHALLAVRVPLVLAPGASATRRFAFGYAPAGTTPAAALAELRERQEGLREDTAAAWHDRLVWAAFPGLPDAGAIQRELAWASYNCLANATFDAYYGVRVLGQGGAYKYIHGLDGAIGDLALFTEALALVDPDLARETLLYGLATQHAATDPTPGRYPYATTGVGTYSDVVVYDQRSDVYFALPGLVGTYLGLTRDLGMLDEPVPFWPRSEGDAGTVLEHLVRTQDYAEDDLGLGARGIVAMGTGDYADGVLNLTEEPTSPSGTSSTYNAGFVVTGFPLLADLIEPVDPALAARYRALAASQAEALETSAFDGTRYYRGFADNGAPLAPDLLFLEPQVLPILAGLTDPQRTEDLLRLVDDVLETPIGAVSTAALGDIGDIGGVDQPQIGGVWPVANAWLTEAHARVDPAAGWESFTRNTLFRHAEEYPEIWYGIWTGPDSFFGPEGERPGEADAHLVTALTDYPALNAHVHTSPLRALRGLLGIEGTADGVRIAPRVPSETFAVRLPRLELDSAPDRIAGRYTPAGSGEVILEVQLPSLLREGAVRVSVDGEPVDYEREGERVRFTAGGIFEVTRG